MSTNVPWRKIIVRNTESGEVDLALTKEAFDKVLEEKLVKDIAESEKKLVKIHQDTAAGFERLLADHLAVQGKYEPVFIEAVAAAFTQSAAFANKNGTLPSPTIYEGARSHLMATGVINSPETMKTVYKLFVEFMEANTSEESDSGALYLTQRGKTGGITKNPNA